MTENERVLHREINRLDSIVDELKRRLQIAENMNFKLYRENQDLSYYIRQMENHTGECTNRM